MANKVLSPAELDSFLKDVPLHVRGTIAMLSQQRQKSVQILPITSRIRFAFARTGAGPFTYTAPVQDRRAFGYGIGQDASGAGFAAGTIATGVETTLQKGGETPLNSDVFILGMGARIVPGADPDLVAAVCAQTWLELCLDGSSSTKIGKILDYPEAGGLHGFAESNFRQPTLDRAGPADGGAGMPLSFISNGNPLASNFRKTGDAWWWQGAGRGRDSNLSVISKHTAAITVSSTARPGNAGAAPGLSGRVEAFTPPANGAACTNLDIEFLLYAITVGDRSINA